MEYTNFIKKPSLDFYPGVIVKMDTVLEYSGNGIKQTLRDLLFHCEKDIAGEFYTGHYETTIKLEEGDILIWDGESNGYIKTSVGFVTVADAIAEMECVKNLG